MKHLAVLIALAISSPAYAAAPPSFTSAQVRQHAAAHCARLFEGRLALQVVCRQQAVEGAAKYDRVVQRHPGDRTMQQSLNHCVRLFSENGTISFNLVGACAEREEEAYKELAR